MGKGDKESKKKKDRSRHRAHVPTAARTLLRYVSIKGPRDVGTHGVQHVWRHRPTDCRVQAGSQASAFPKQCTDRRMRPAALFSILFSSALSFISRCVFQSPSSSISSLSCQFSLFSLGFCCGSAIADYWLNAHFSIIMSRWKFKFFFYLSFIIVKKTICKFMKGGHA